MDQIKVVFIVYDVFRMILKGNIFGGTHHFKGDLHSNSTTILFDDWALIIQTMHLPKCFIPLPRSIRLTVLYNMSMQVHNCPLTTKVQCRRRYKKGQLKFPP